jgi:hypothetical protein
LDKDEKTALLKLNVMAITKKMLKDFLTNLVASADAGCSFGFDHF